MSFNPQNYFLKRMGNCDFKIKYKNYSFSKPETKFGRAPDCDLILKNMRCSLNHCKITFENGRMFIEDSSSVGTYVNNERINNRKVELFEGTIVGMGANPNRPEHVDKLNFYIYRVQKVEAPIILDSSDDDDDDEGFGDSIPISRSEAKENEEFEELDQNDSTEVAAANEEDSNDTIQLETNENSEDLTQKIEEHLTAEETLKIEAVDINKIDSQVPVTPAIIPQIKLEPETIDDAIKRMLNNCQSKRDKRMQKSLETSTPEAEEAGNPQDSGKISRLSTAKVQSSAELESEWISTAFVGDSDAVMSAEGQEANGQAKAANQGVKICSTAPAASKVAESSHLEQESLDLPTEPPIFAPGPSNFQPIPLHLIEAASLIGKEQQQTRSTLAEAPNHLTQSPAPSSTPKAKFANLALRKKVLQSTSSSSSSTSSPKTSTPPQPLNYSPISSTSNISSSALSSISSEKLRTTSRSNSAASSASIPSSDEQSKTLTPDQIKTKTKFLRHYGQQGTKLIEMPENPMNQTNDLLDEVGPKEAVPIIWKLGVAMVKPVRKAKTKRGRKKKPEDDGDNSGSSGSENGSSGSKISDLTSKNGNITSKNGNITLKNGNITSKIDKNSQITKNLTSKNVDTASEPHCQFPNSSNPTKLKATARKTTSAGSAVVKRPFACVNDNRPKSDDSDSSNDYQSAKSGSSEPENKEPNQKKQKVDTKVGQALKLALKEQKLIKQAQEGKTQAVPTTSNAKKLHKFPDSDEDSSNSKKPKVAAKIQQKGPKMQKPPVRRESIINLKRPSIQKKAQQPQLSQYLATNKIEAPMTKLAGTTQQNEPKIVQGTSKSTEIKSPQKSHHAGPSSRPSIHQTLNFPCKFPHLYQFDSNTKSDSPPKSPTAAPKPISMKKRRQSVFEEQAQLIPENLPFNERTNAMRRWNQNTTKLIDIQAEDPNKKKRGRPKLNEDERIKMLVGRIKGVEERK